MLNSVCCFVAWCLLCSNFELYAGAMFQNICRTQWLRAVLVGMKFMLDSLRSLGTRGSKLIRLDAFGYATKTPGTRCFFQVGPPAASVHLCKHVCAQLAQERLATSTLCINTHP